MIAFFWLYLLRKCSLDQTTVSLFPFWIYKATDVSSHKGFHLWVYVTFYLSKNCFLAKKSNIYVPSSIRIHFWKPLIVHHSPNLFHISGYWYGSCYKCSMKQTTKGSIFQASDGFFFKRPSRRGQGSRGGGVRMFFWPKIVFNTSCNEPLFRTTYNCPTYFHLSHPYYRPHLCL